MTRRAAPAPPPKLPAQGWLVGLSMTFAAVMWMVYGVPGSHDTSPSYPRSHSSSSSSAPGYYLEDRDHNYPSVNGPNVGKWAGKAGRAVGRALR